MIRITEVYVIEECLVPGVWVLSSSMFYFSKDEADNNLKNMTKAYKSMNKYFLGRVTELHPNS